MRKGIFLSLSKISMITLLIAGLLAGILPVHSASAGSTIQVNSYDDVLADDGYCTLRESIIAANDDQASGDTPGECTAGNGDDIINLPAGTYNLSRSDAGYEDSSRTGDLDILDDLSISGAGADITIIDIVGDKKGRIFDIIDGAVSISGVSMLNGYFRDFGGGIYNAGDLTLHEILISGNTARYFGGGIFNAGTLTITNSTLENNKAGLKGGGIYNTGTVDLQNVTINKNFAQEINDDEDLGETEGTTAPAEDGDLAGGGFFNAAGTANFYSTTFFGNGVLGETEINIGDSIYLVGGNASFNNSILAYPANGQNCSGPISSLGYNLSSDSSCTAAFNQPGDLNNVDPMLNALADNGGTTPTHSIQAGSPAYDAGDDLNCPPTDQRGAPRPQGDACDIGAYEAGKFDSWVTAQEIIPDVTLYEYISKPNQSRWFKFKVQPGSRVIATLTELPENYDLTLYKDIAAAYQTLLSSEDLTRLGAEFAPDAFSPDAFSPDAFSPDAYSPDAFSPDAFSPDAYSPDAFSPDAYSPDAFSPDAYSPDAYSPDAFSPDAFSGAQMQSLIAVSAFDGTAGEGIVVNTWDNEGYFYLRVRGRNGVYDLGTPFRLDVVLIPGECSAVSAENLPATSLPGESAGFRTIILTDFDRMTGTAAQKNDLQNRLTQVASRPEVAGAIVDVSSDARVAAANAQADQYPTCPHAKNLVAGSIKSVIDNYRELNPLQYVVIIGNDDVIPFFRHADHAMLANEKNYAPPVKDSTASQASLKLGYFLSQDRYGSSFDISIKSNQLPVPDLPVGRLTETLQDVNSMLDAYLKTTGGILPAPKSSLVTGYDFLEDAALAVQSELSAGIGTIPDSLISPRDISPLDPSAWDADQLREILFGSRHDLIFLAGHFSASSALAADYKTRLLSTEVLESPVDLENVLVYSAGCHSGYNIVDAHGVPGVTREPDWAQTFAKKGATLIAGTGYQYGDTDFIAYSEQLYLGFTRQLRSGSGPVPIGKALVEAKKEYLESTTQMKGIHEKALLEATLFGLPMLSVNMPGARLDQPTLDASNPGSTNTGIPAAASFDADPGLTLGLQYADISIVPSLTQHQVELTNPSDGTVSIATYLSGSDGIITNPAEPVLPLEIRDVSLSGTVARGVGFRGGAYSDFLDILPLTGAAATEIRGIHTPFLSDIFFPVVPWRLNYFEALTSAGNGSTNLFFTPAQFQSNPDDPLLGRMRQYTRGDFRIYYSSNFQTFQGNSIPALAAPPDITEINAIPGDDEITFEVHVLGNPAAGIQEVWLVYTSMSGPLAGLYQPLDLVQNPQDSTLWTGTLPLGGMGAGEIRYMVQAVNGVGLVSISTNLGVSYIPGLDNADKELTSLVLETPVSTSAYGSQVTFSAVLTSNGAPLAGKIIHFGLGTMRKLGITNSNGRAVVTMPLLGIPGNQNVKATFTGSFDYLGTTAASPFLITKAGTKLLLDPESTSGLPDEEGLASAILTDNDGRRLSEKSVFFVITGQGRTYAESPITDYSGRATIGKLPYPYPPGVYTVEAYFSGNVPLPGYPISLNDDRFEPASTSGTITIEYPYNLTFFPFVYVP